MKRFAGVAVVLGMLGVTAAFLLWWLPADDFLLVPDRAKPLAGKVVVEREDSAGATGKGDVYYVDLFVRRIRRLEQLLPFTRPDGSTLVPESALAPDGTTDEERDRQNAADMRRSELIASVVALRSLGYDVVATPRGVLVTSVVLRRPGRKVARGRRRHRRRRRHAGEDASPAASSDRSTEVRETTCGSRFGGTRSRSR